MDKKKSNSKEQPMKPSSPASQSSSQIPSSELRRRGFTGSISKRPIFQTGGVASGSSNAVSFVISMKLKENTPLNSKSHRSSGEPTSILMSYNRNSKDSY